MGNSWKFMFNTFKLFYAKDSMMLLNFPTLLCRSDTQRKRFAAQHYFSQYCWQRLSAAGRDFTLCKSVRP